MDTLAIMEFDSGSLFDPKIPWVGSESRRQNQEFDQENWAEEPQSADVLKRMRPLINFIESDLASYPTPVRLPIRWAGSSTVFGISQMERTISRLLALDIEHALFHREAERAFRGVQGMQTTRRAFDSSWSLIGSLLAFDSERIERSTIRRSLAIDLWSDEQLDGLLKSVTENRDFQSHWKQMMHSEAVFFIEIWRGLENGDSSMLDFTGSVNEIPPAVKWFLEDSSSKAKLLDFYVKCAQASEQGVEGLEARLTKLTKTTYPDLNDSERGFTDTLARMLFTSYANIGRIWENREDDRRFTLTAIAIKQYQKKFDCWPKTLSQLVDVGLGLEDWTTTIDEPFGYQHDGDSVVLWTYSSENIHLGVRPRVPKNFEDAQYESTNNKSEKVATYYTRIR
jgi:hypothetical protein